MPLCSQGTGARRRLVVALGVQQRLGTPSLWNDVHTQRRRFLPAWNTEKEQQEQMNGRREARCLRSHKRQTWRRKHSLILPRHTNPTSREKVDSSCHVHLIICVTKTRAVFGFGFYKSAQQTPCCPLPTSLHLRRQTKDTLIPHFIQCRDNR